MVAVAIDLCSNTYGNLEFAGWIPKNKGDAGMVINIEKGVSKNHP